MSAKKKYKYQCLPTDPHKTTPGDIRLWASKYEDDNAHRWQYEKTAIPKPKRKKPGVK